jgi:hypothetical protein
MQYSKHKKRKKKVLIKQIRSENKYNNQFDAFLIKIQAETFQFEVEFAVREFVFLVSKNFFSGFSDSSIDHTFQLSTVLMTKVLNFVNRSSTITVIFSSNFDLIPMLNQSQEVLPTINNIIYWSLYSIPGKQSRSCLFT